MSQSDLVLGGNSDGTDAACSLLPLSALLCARLRSTVNTLPRTQKKWEPPLPTRVGKKKKRGPDPSQKRKSLSSNCRAARKLTQIPLCI